MPMPQKESHSIKDIYALPDGKRAELIDGQIYMMAPPTRIHQKLISELTQHIGHYIRSKGCACDIYPAPFAVFLDKDDKNYVEPDLSIICDKSKLDDRGCNGAPDWIIEIISPSTQQIDYGIKLFKYRSAGVREYWIVNPLKNTVNVFDFGCDNSSGLYDFSDDIYVCIYNDLNINIMNLLK